MNSFLKPEVPLYYICRIPSGNSQEQFPSEIFFNKGNDFNQVLHPSNSKTNCQCIECEINQSKKIFTFNYKFAGFQSFLHIEYCKNIYESCCL